MDFYEILSQTRQHLSEVYGNFLSRLLQNRDDEKMQLLESYIQDFIQKSEFAANELEQKALTQRLISEMMGYSFLDQYLERVDVEEININGWRDVKITYSDGSVVPAKEAFRSKEHAVDIVRKMLRESNMIWDAAQCIQVGHLPGNIRITAVGFDVIDSNAGLAVSIRKVNPKNLMREHFIKLNTATGEMLDMLAQFYSRGISICVSGATNSGKSTLVSWILSCVPDSKRLITIEQGARDFNCVKIEDGVVKNNVIHLSTRSSKDPDQNITQSKLLETIMTMNPDYIAVGESKGEEAMQAVTAANTGHSVITTTHANNAEQTYTRLVLLCKMMYPNMDDQMLKEIVVQAFPITAFIYQMDDHYRRVTQINEASWENGTIVYRPLYQFKVISNRDGQVHGVFEKVNTPSEALKKRLLASGMEDAAIHRFFNKEGE